MQFEEMTWLIIPIFSFLSRFFSLSSLLYFYFSVFFLLSTHWIIELELETEYVEDRVGSWRVCRSAL